EFDTGLRNAFETGANGGEVVFIEKDTEKGILPCSPNKIMLSRINMLKAEKRLLPIGFQTIARSYLEPLTKKIDEFIGGLIENPVQTTAIDGNSFLIDKVTAERIIEMISETYDDKQGYEWDVQAFLSVLNYLTESSDTNEQGNVWLVIRKNRNIS